ncbi:integrase [Xenorhabdus sp. TS4]|nr:integrase [Xenorhabdus sp. TS4]
MSLIRNAFKRLHYPTGIIVQCVCGYLSYALSLRNLEGIFLSTDCINIHLCNFASDLSVNVTEPLAVLIRLIKLTTLFNCFSRHFFLFFF